MTKNIKFYRTGTLTSGFIGINYAITVDFEPYFIGTRSVNGISYLMELGPQKLSPEWKELSPSEVPINVLIMMDEKFGNLKLFETYSPTLFNSIEKEKEFFKPSLNCDCVKLMGMFYTRTEAELIRSCCSPVSSIFEIPMDKFDFKYVYDCKFKPECLYSNVSTYVDASGYHHSSAIEFSLI